MDAILRNTKKSFVIALFALFFALVIVMKQGWDYDIWIHLKYGQHFVKNLTWSIDHAQFSWTPANRPWMYVTWIGSSLIYIIYQHFSFAGVFALPPIILICTALVYLCFLRIMSLGASIMSLGLFILLAPFFYAAIIKTAMFTPLCFAVCVAAYFSARGGHLKMLWLLPPIFWIWANTHGGFVFGLFFLAFALLSDWLLERRNEKFDHQYFKTLTLATLLSFLATCINPHGFLYLIGIAKDILASDALDPSTNISEYRNLWTTLDPMQESIQFIGTAWSIACFYLLFMLLHLLLIKQKQRYHKTPVLLVSIYFLMAMLCLRFVSYFAVVQLFATAYILSLTQSILPIKRVQLVTAVLALYFTVMPLYGTFSNFGIPNSIFPDPYKIYPIHASMFLKEHQIPAPIMNNYVIGGHLIWANYPEQKAFADPRYWPYRKDILADCFAMESAENEQLMHDLLRKYPDTKAFYLNTAYINPIRLLLGMSDWKLVYFDQVAVVFVKKSEPQSKINPDLSTNRFAAITSPIQLAPLFMLYFNMKQFDAAQSILEHYKRNVYPDYMFRGADLRYMQLVLEKALKK